MSGDFESQVGYNLADASAGAGAGSPAGGWQNWPNSKCIRRKWFISR